VNLENRMENIEGHVHEVFHHPLPLFNEGGPVGALHMEH